MVNTNEKCCTGLSMIAWLVQKLKHTLELFLLSRFLEMLALPKPFDLCFQDVNTLSNRTTSALEDRSKIVLTSNDNLRIRLV
jgi:hypothetical protein